MGEDRNYSTLVFQNRAAAQTEEKDNQTIYSEVKHKKRASTAATADEDLMVYDQVKPKAAAVKVQKNRRLLMCLGTLCVLLAAGLLVLLVTLILKMKQQEATISHFTAQNKILTDRNKNLPDLIEQLNAENNNLLNETQELKKETDDLSWTLQVILTFDCFPVKDFCPNKKCQACRNPWLQFRDSCYLFWKEAAPWKTWDQSRQFCQSKSSDLVVINDLQEQEFVSNHSEPYFDNAHGYWLGLRQMNNIWVWVDGQNDTVRYWVPGEISAASSYVLLMPTGPDENLNLPRRNLTQTWKTADSGFQLKFICELRALIKSS